MQQSVHHYTFRPCRVKLVCKILILILILHYYYSCNDALRLQYMIDNDNVRSSQPAHSQHNTLYNDYQAINISLYPGSEF